VIDHLSLGTTELARAIAFWDAALAPLGAVRVWTAPDAAGYGPPGGDDRLAIKARAGAAAPGAGFHIALSAPTRAAVDEFHRAALAHAGRDDGAPGLRPQYGPGYYAAFVIDPDGHHVEAVFHEPQPIQSGRSMADSGTSR
jgi:catechol 2,3-dioxygenase-like lactoylglutathione lyase family enzyme